MLKLLLLFYGFGTLLALTVQSNGRLDLSPELKGRFDAAYSVVENVNLADAGWEAQVYPRFARMSDEERRSMNGLVINKNKAPLFKGPIVETPIVIKAEDLPEEFDPRKQWPQCVNVIDNIRDQSNCGSCWAVAAAGVLSDRICIKSKGHMNLSISSIDIASCALSPMDGCGGAQDLSPAWKYLQQKGTVTGHNYKSNVGCKPYPFPPSKDAREQPYHTPNCMEECTNKEYERKYDEDRIKTAEPIRLQTNDWKNMEHLIKQEVYVNGSVEVGFTICKDFYYYSKGVYKHTYGREEGGHAVRLVGWGVEKEVPYWLIANSWGPEWGEKGYFRIRRGFNECGIEGLTDPYAGEPILKMSH